MAAGRWSSPTACSTFCILATWSIWPALGSWEPTLLVGVNSDHSARQLGKGAGRPVNAEHDRALLIAALQSVSYVTLFDETTPCELIRRCRPDVYVKGGDYDIEALEETRTGQKLGRPCHRDPGGSGLLEQCAGAAHSRPGLIDCDSMMPLNTARPQPGRRAAFIDRDGVINVESGFVHRLEDLVFLPGAIEGLQCACRPRVICWW